MAEIVKGIDLSKGVPIEGRLFIAPEEAREKLARLEALAEAVKDFDVFSAYERSIAHDGLHEDDIYHSGRYYAYLRYELPGLTPEEKEKRFAETLAPLIEKFSKEEVERIFPPVIKGRQVTENLMLRPENDDYASYYSRTRTNYAEKMALEEIPKTVITLVREQQEAVLNSFHWDVFYVLGNARIEGGELLELCGNVYLVPKDKRPLLAVYEAIWAALAAGVIERSYDIVIFHDGLYPADENNPLGRYYAYVRATLKGTSTEEREKFLWQNLGSSFPKDIGEERILDYFPETIEGDAVTKPLTIRPETDDFPSYYIASKLEPGRERAKKQIMLNASATILERVEKKLGAATKVVVLEA
jgi:hypothetical protein